MDHDVKSTTKNPTFMDVSMQPEGGLPSFFVPSSSVFLNLITASTVPSALMNDELICHVSLSFRL